MTVDLLPRMFSDLQNSWVKVTHSTQNRKENYDIKKISLLLARECSFGWSLSFILPYMCGKCINSCLLVQKRQACGSSQVNINASEDGASLWEILVTENKKVGLNMCQCYQLFWPKSSDQVITMHMARDLISSHLCVMIHLPSNRKDERIRN